MPKQKTKKRYQRSSRTRFTEFFRHVFVPHHKNSYQPHAIRIHGVGFVLAMIVMLQFGYNFAATGSVLGDQVMITDTQLLKATNDQREASGISSLSLNTSLASAARLKADDMFRQQYWAHTAPDGATPWQWFSEAGYSYQYAGENLAKGFENAPGVVTAWMNSEEHRDNMLSRNFREVGFAIKQGVLNGENTTLIVALYGQPASAVASATQPARTVAASGSELGVISRFGIGLQSMTPAMLASGFLLLLLTVIALLAHTYRHKLPKSMQSDWRRHHGLYKATGMMGVVLVLLYTQGGGQI